MKILFDNIIFARQKCGGISVVWYELIRRSLKAGLDLHFIDFQPNRNILRDALEIPGHLMTVADSGYRKILKYLPVTYKCREPFIFHSSYYRFCLNRHAINVTTVHDFTNELYQTGPGAVKDRWIKHHAIRNSDYIICISENTKKDFRKFFPQFPEERIRVIYNGVSEDYHPLNEPVGSLCPFLSHSYILFVGERGGYKNFSLVVETLKSHNIDLVIVGNELCKSEASSLTGIKGHYYYAGRLDSVTLNKFYNDAMALVYPSSYEGFGLPVIEAQKAGCPVIAYNASSIPEITGDTTLLMNELTPEELISRIRLAGDAALHRQIIENGLENAGRFSWEKTFMNTMEVYNEAMKLKS